MFVYAIKRKDNKWFRPKQQRYLEQWVNSLEEAKIYTKLSSVKARLTFWKRCRPEWEIEVVKFKLQEVLSSGSST